MIPAPLNSTRDDKPPPRTIAGCVFDFHTGKCSCGKVYSDIAPAPETAIGDHKQSGIWCHSGTLSRYEWTQIQDENNRIMACCKS
jgi:hypothetical protein